MRFLVRLYPANWRQRYGEEFEALLEDTPPGWAGIFDLLKGAIKMQLFVPAFPKLALMLGVMGLLGGLAISFVVTPKYVSQAEMTFQSVTNSTQPEVRRNLTERVVQIENEILSRTSLSNIIQDPRLDLYKEERARTPMEDVIERMRTRDLRIRVETAGQDYISFRVSFAYSDRVKAQQIVQVLITKFVDANLIDQESQARLQRASTSDQIYRLEARIAALEKRLGIPSTSHEPDFSPVSFGGTQLFVLDPPSLPLQLVYPDRVRFMAAGFGLGFVTALVVAIFRRRPPAIAFLAQTA